MTDDVSITQADIRAALDHLGWEDYDDFCAWALSNDEMGRFDDLTVAFARHRETGTRAPVPNGQSPNSNVIPSDLDALVEDMARTIASYCDVGTRERTNVFNASLKTLTSLRNQLTASEARERELREALSGMVDAATRDANNNRSISGPMIARLCDARDALTNTENRYG